MATVASRNARPGDDVAGFSTTSKPLYCGFVLYSMRTRAVPLNPHILRPVPKNPPLGKISSKPDMA